MRCNQMNKARPAYIILIMSTVFVIWIYNDCMDRSKFTRVVATHIPVGESVLDFGSGNCELSAFLGNRNSTTSVDIFKGCKDADVYDGHILPYPDDSFDVVVSMFVLHHIPHHTSIVKELKRVARKRIILVEDHPITTYDRLISKLHYLCFNQPTHMIEHMKHPNAWVKLLNGSCSVHRICERSFLNSTPHFMIVWEKNNGVI